jgi:hypothetical protein
MEGEMNKVWFGLAFSFELAFSVIVDGPASAQNYNKNFVERMKELGLPANAGNPYKLSVFHSEAQEAAFSDCVTRKALP